MNWKVYTLLAVVLSVLAACANSAPTTDGGQTTIETGSTLDADALPSEMLPVVAVYKSPTCGCCNGWVEHMEEAGFMVEAHDVTDLAAVKQENEVPGGLQSCHTAIVDGYVIEGHVPAEDVRQLLTERPAVAGLAVPGMPIGSPGMEVRGTPAQPFDVVSFDADGNVNAFASHNN